MTNAADTRSIWSRSRWGPHGMTVRRSSTPIWSRRDRAQPPVLSRVQVPPSAPHATGDSTRSPDVPASQVSGIPGRAERAAARLRGGTDEQDRVGHLLGAVQGVWAAAGASGRPVHRPPRHMGISGRRSPAGAVGDRLRDLSQQAEPEPADRVSHPDRVLPQLCRLGGPGV